MAPAQILDLPQTQTNYTHKKFQGNRYAHKKFGTRTPSPPTVQHHQFCEELLLAKDNHHATMTTLNENSLTNSNKRSSGDIFRPYALGDTPPRKRKHHELHDDVEQEEEEQQYSYNHKRFAPSPISPAVSVTIPHLSPPIFFPLPPPNYRLQHYQFNAQTFALILQKQQAALCMGEILKRQSNFNLHNIRGN